MQHRQVPAQAMSELPELHVRTSLPALQVGMVPNLAGMAWHMAASRVTQLLPGRRWCAGVTQSVSKVLAARVSVIAYKQLRMVRHRPGVGFLEAAVAGGITVATHLAFFQR